MSSELDHKRSGRKREERRGGEDFTLGVWSGKPNVQCSNPWRLDLKTQQRSEKWRSGEKMAHRTEQKLTGAIVAPGCESTTPT